ncbi:hypothetical protein NMG60_11022782 [Bertholletia excelsa]
MSLSQHTWTGLKVKAGGELCEDGGSVQGYIIWREVAKWDLEERGRLCVVFVLFMGFVNCFLPVGLVGREIRRCWRWPTVPTRRAKGRDPPESPGVTIFWLFQRKVTHYYCHNKVTFVMI